MGKEKIKKYYALFSCGHKSYISYYGKNDLLQKLNKAECEGLCPICKLEEFKKKSVLVLMPYSDYKKMYAHKRGIMKGQFIPSKKMIEIYMSEEKADEYRKLKERVWYDAVFVGCDDNDNVVISLFLKGNSYRIKDELKSNGYKWVNQRWCKDIIVFPGKDENDNYRLYPQDNPEFYDNIKVLEELGCIDNIISLNFHKKD